jgi:hypothetical protein
MKNLSIQQFAILGAVIIAIIASLTVLVVTGHMDPSMLKTVIVGIMAWLIPSPAINPASQPIASGVITSPFGAETVHVITKEGDK